MKAHKRRSIQVLKAMAALALLFFAHRSFAVCSGGTDALAVADINFSGSADVLKPGTLINATWTQAGKARMFELADCKAASASTKPAKVAIPGLSYNDGTASYPVYPTGVDGIGYVVGVKEQLSNVSWKPSTSPQTVIYQGNAADPWSYMGTFARIAFVATGRLKSGSYTIPAQTIITSDVFKTADASGPPATAAPSSISLNATKITINASTCRMTTPVEQSVTLPAVARSALPAAGSLAGVASFRIGLNCDANMKVYATMTDASTPTNTGSILSLASGSTASGVGVQVFRDGLSTPVSFGPDSSVLGNTNQWPVGSSVAATTYAIPFLAAYVRTAGDITAGSVKAKATITFSYQ